MNHNELTKMLRDYLKVSGIACRVWKQTMCKTNFITVKPIDVDSEFSAEDCRTIKIYAKGLGLTHVQGTEIDIDLYTCKDQCFEVA